MTVENEAKKAGADISGCSIVDPQVCEISRYSPNGNNPTCKSVSRHARAHPSTLHTQHRTTYTYIHAHYIHAQNCSRIDKYVDALVEARKKKGISREVATDQVTPGDARG